MHSDLRPAVLALAWGFVVLSTGCAASSAAPVTYAVQSLSAEVNGDQVRTSTVVRASRSVDVEQFGICVRSDRGSETDFVLAEATVTTAGTSYVSDTFPLAAGTYTYYPCFDVQGTRVALPGHTLQITAPVGAEPKGTAGRTPAPGRSATPGGSTAGVGKGPIGPAGSWRPVFADEFSGQRLDREKWRPNWLAGNDEDITKPVDSAELSCYDPANVSVRDGSARLKLEKRSCTDNMGRSYAFASGLIESADHFEFRYGFAETRLFLPAGADRNCGPNWPAFWLNGQSLEDGEIDVMECLGSDVEWHYHIDGFDASGLADEWKAAMPPPEGWHTFGVDWRPGSLVFYYDGINVGAVTRRVTGSPHFLIVNLAASGAETVEQTLKVDYVRVWQRR